MTRPDTFTRDESGAASYERANTHTDRPSLADLGPEFFDTPRRCSGCGFIAGHSASCGVGGA